MKSKINLLLVAFAAACLALAACNGDLEMKNDTKSEMKVATRPLAAGEKIMYQCPMCKDQISDKPGKCPNCGMKMEQVIMKDTVTPTVKDTVK